MTSSVRPRRRSGGSWALVALVVVATGLGAVRFSAMRTSDLQPSTVRIGAVTYRVTGAEQVRGLSDADLSGMAHGIQGLVTSDKALVTVSIVVSAGDSPATFDPTDLEVVGGGSSTPIRAVGATLSGGPLDAHASLEGAISFVVPRDGSRLALVAPGQSHVVDLLQVDTFAAGSGSRAHEASATAAATVGPTAAER